MCAIMCRCDNCHTSPLKMPQNTAKKNTAKNGETLEATGIPNDFKGSLFVMHRKEGGEPTSKVIHRKVWFQSYCLKPAHAISYV